MPMSSASISTERSHSSGVIFAAVFGFRADLGMVERFVGPPASPRRVKEQEFGMQVVAVEAAVEDRRTLPVAHAQEIRGELFRA